MNKQKIKKELKFYGRKATAAFVMAIVFVTVAGTSIWALAAFTEPTDTPSNSVQDWAKNIMGANNADNAFDSSSVTANSDGSIIERLENLESDGSVTAMSAIGSGNMNYVTAAQYCFDLSATAEVANTGSNTSTTYTDWRMGSISELGIFVGQVSGTELIWTTTPRSQDNYLGYWYALRMSDGYSNNASIYNQVSRSIRCIR